MVLYRMGNSQSWHGFFLKLKKIKVGWKKIATDLAGSWDSNALEARYLCHRQFEPLVDLMVAANKDRTFQRTTTQSAFSEAAGIVGSGVTTVMTVSHSLINWQSAHGSHTNDKEGALWSCYRPALPLEREGLRPSSRHSKDDLGTRRHVEAG